MIYHSDLVFKKHLHLKKKHFFFIQLLFASHSMHDCKQSMFVKCDFQEYYIATLHRECEHIGYTISKFSFAQWIF